MGHDDGTNDAHCLQQLRLPTAWAGGQEQALKKCSLGWTRYHIL